MLVEGGLLSEEQLQQAVVSHKQKQLKLGQFLVREGIVSGAQIVDLVCRQLKMKKYQPDKYPIDMSLSKIIPVDIAQKYHVVPLNKSRYLLTIAMTDPMDIKALDAIEVLTNTEVEAVMCTDQELNHLIGADAERSSLPRQLHQFGVSNRGSLGNALKRSFNVRVFGCVSFVNGFFHRHGGAFKIKRGFVRLAAKGHQRSAHIQRH